RAGCRQGAPRRLVRVRLHSERPSLEGARDAYTRAEMPLAHAAWTDWSLAPLQVAPIAALAIAYEWRARTLAQRGQPDPAWRHALFWLSVVLLLVALVSPI